LRWAAQGIKTVAAAIWAAYIWIMPRTCTFLLTFWLGATVLLAQTAGTVQATGSASVNANPDQATLTVGVVTQGATAQDAAQQNASLATAVQNAIRSVLGTNGTVQTIAYSVTPRYNNSQPAAIIGYTASNTVLVTMYDISKIGTMIDTANQAGANNVGGVNFGLRNSDPFVQTALGQAAKQALTHAGAIAAGLGAKTGAVISAQEGVSYSPIAVSAPGAGATPTPIQTGLVTVSASVTVNVQLLQ
jgi:uncharacterized protein YggE